MKLLNVRSAIYDHFHKSSAVQAYFARPENADGNAASYTAMYLIQDTGEAVATHMACNFSPEPMRAYIEFWGVMQAISIQQDAICEMHRVVAGKEPTIQDDSSWDQLRDLRIQLAGHPANRSRGVPATQRTFLGRCFGNYQRIQYEQWDAGRKQTSHPSFALGQLINDYDLEAGTILDHVLSTMKSKWP